MELPSTPVYDAVVIGLGAVGSFALRALAKEGEENSRFLGIERYKYGHEFGSSHGLTRIYRRAYFEHPNYVPWIQHSIRVFHELDKSQKESLIQECGTLLMEPNNGGTTVNDLPPFCKPSYESAQEHGIKVQYLSSRYLKERFPQFSYKHGMVGLFEPGGGMLRPERILQSALADARATGHVDIMEQTQVLSFEELPSDDKGERPLVKLRIRRDSGEEETITTRSLLIAAGGWTGQLIPSWAPYAQPMRQIQGWIDVSKVNVDPGLYCYKQMPTWGCVVRDWPIPLYGTPCDSDDPEHSSWLKIGLHGRKAPIQNLTKNQTEPSPAEIVEIQEAASRVFDRRIWNASEDLPEFVKVMPCIYTMTPDEHFMIGTPNGLKSVFAIAGLSGHGFKMSASLGQMMADFAFEKDLQKWNIDFCSPTRFGV